ncbi:transcriptional regulator [Rhizobium sp. 57MFTsu3.2]|uniref:helix-turn-helix domain-containing protein n=1 Tax=Rhizobium sp. 57MFTsu3.2 TaxID=1048681 RepID=UPI0032B187EE
MHCSYGHAIAPFDRNPSADGIDRSYVGRVERGEENVTVALEAFAFVLSVGVAALFKEIGPHEGKPKPLRSGRKPKGSD